MKTLFSILAISFFTLNLISQDEVVLNSRKVDFKEIEQKITNEKSDFFYEKLLNKYYSPDKELSLNEYWYLYYGYTFSNDYFPYEATQYQEELKKYTSKERLEKSDYENIIKLAEKELEKLPFELDMLWYIYIANKEIGNEEKANNTYKKFSKIIDTILQSGNGSSESEAFVVTYTSHEYIILDVLGLEYGGKQTLTQGLCDFLTVMPNEYNIEGIYFDVNRIFEVNMKRINE